MAFYHGRRVTLNKPVRSDNPKKHKKMVYVKKGDRVVKVQFGDPNMRIKKCDPSSALHDPRRLIECGQVPAGTPALVPCASPLCQPRAQVQGAVLVVQGLVILIRGGAKRGSWTA